MEELTTRQFHIPIMADDKWLSNVNETGMKGQKHYEPDGLVRNGPRHLRMFRAGNWNWLKGRAVFPGKYASMVRISYSRMSVSRRGIRT